MLLSYITLQARAIHVIDYIHQLQLYIKFHN